MTTAERLNKVADHIEALPHAKLELDEEKERVQRRMDELQASDEGASLKEFNIGIYTCGTAGCVAAHVVDVLGTAWERQRMYGNILDVRSTALRLLLKDEGGTDIDYGECEAGYSLAGALFYGPDTYVNEAQWLANMSGREYETELTPQRAAHAMRLYAGGHQVGPWNRAIEELGR